MVETEVLKIQVVSIIKLVVAAYLLYIWIPRKVFPQEYIDNPLDRVMFNIIHMTAVITLVFPLFIFLKVFGLLFMIIFFVALRLLFIKYYYKKDLWLYLRFLYHNSIARILHFLDNPKLLILAAQKWLYDKARATRERITGVRLLFGVLIALVMSYALYLRTYRGLVSLVGAVPDMYQYYFWGNILKSNVLFSKETVSPYMWSGPVLVHTTNLLANLNTVVMYNIFPFLFLSFMLFSMYYFLKGLLENNGSRTASMAVAIVLFGIVIPSPLGQEFLGSVFKTLSPDLFNISFLSVYFSGFPKPEDSLVFDPFHFFWRLTTTLPYEIAASFFLANLYFLIKYFETRRTAFLLLFAESLAIVFSIHGGVVVPLVASSLFIFCYAVLSRKVTLKQVLALTGGVAAATVIGNAWLLQTLKYKLAIPIGPAAPFLEGFLDTKIAAEQAFDRSTQLVFSPVEMLIVLAGVSLLIVIASFFIRQMRFPLACIGLSSLAVVLLYFGTNLGLPMLVGHERLVLFVTYCYAIVFATLYYLLIEKGILQLLFRKLYFVASMCLLLIVSLAAILVTPRWIDTKTFWDGIYYTEYNRFPYFVYEMEDKFQPFTYTIVSYVQEFPQVISKGYHVNTQDLLQEYSPADKKLRIPTEYVFLFVENVPQKYRGTGEYWYRWRRDIMLKLKDWVAIYGQYHDNIRLWHSDDLVEIYLIDNRDKKDRT